MDFNLLQSVRDFFTPDAVDQTASQLGENSSSITKALSGVIPSVLGGVIHQAESGRAADLLTSATEAAGNTSLNAGSLLGNLSSATSGGGGLLGNLFGNKLGGISSALTSFAGIKNTSVQSLLGLVAPVVLSLIGRHAQQNNLSANGLSSFLSSQKSTVMNAMPSGLNIGNLLGFNAGDAAGHVRDTATAARHAVSEAAPRRNLLPWILLGLGAIALLYFLSRGCNDNAATTTTTDTTTNTTVAPAPAPVATDAGRTSMMVKLPDGTELNAYRGGIEDQLVTCLNDASCQAGKDKWFDFDNINFETGSAKLTAESQGQISNLAAILKAYPKAEVKIGGYTDKTGNEDANKKLSTDRAKAVDAALKAAGVDSKRLSDPEGYGSQFAKVAATASDEERRPDRRISVQLRSK